MNSEIEVVFTYEKRHHIMDDIRRFTGYLNLQIAKQLFPFDGQKQFEALNNVCEWKVESIDWSKIDEERKCNDCDSPVIDRYEKLWKQAGISEKFIGSGKGFARYFCPACRMAMHKIHTYVGEKKP